jgi:hypothetical protein
VFVVFDPTNAYPSEGPAISHENYPAASVISDINAAALAFGLGFPPASGFAPDPSQPTQVQIQLTAVDSIRIDTVTGNSAIGFPPGEVAFGEKTVVIDGEPFTFSTEFPITKEVGDTVQKLDPITDGVEVLHYIADPIWWEVFGLSSLTPEFTLAKGYSKDDIKIINEILKYHLFGVKIVPDAFTRLGNIELSIVAKFINDIRAIFTNYIILIPFRLLDVFGLTDDADLDGRPDDVETIQLVFPPTLDNPPWNMISTGANNPPPHFTSFSASNGGITIDNVVDGTYAGDTSWLELDAYDIELANGGSIDVIGGGYDAAETTGSASGPFDTSSATTPLTVVANGQIINIAYGDGVGLIPNDSAVSAHDVAAAINVGFGSLATGSAYASVTPDQKIHIRVDLVNGVGSPTLSITSSNPELGLTTIGPISGSAGTLLSQVSF